MAPGWYTGRQQGLDYDEAAKQVAWLATEALRRGLSGASLKPDAGASLAPDLHMLRQYISSILAFHGILTLAACGDAGTALETGSDSDTGSTGAANGSSTGDAPTTAPDAPTTGGSTTGDGTTADSTTGESTTGDAGTGTSDTSTGSSNDPGDSSSGSTTGAEDTTTGANDEACQVQDLLGGPPVVMIDGLVAVPIDIDMVDAKVVLDATAKSALAEATMQFRTGPQDGHPIFDLRQTIVAATLDGAAVPPSALAMHDFGLGLGSGLRILEVELPPCTDHTLHLTYALNKPGAPNSRAITWLFGSTRVKWDLWSSDLYPGRYLEQWFPANLVHDKFSFTLDIELKASNFEHTLVTNGVTELIGASHWKVDYPPTFTALSPMLVLVANDRVFAETHELALANDVKVTLDLYQDFDVGADLAAVTADITGYMNEFIASTGAYAHGDRLTVYIWNEASRSMEYDGAATTRVDALAHELFHSWYGRGVKPASQNDGWIDEAWDMHSVDVGFNGTPLDFNAPPVQLASPSPWNRITPDTAYFEGEQVFAGLAAMLGIPPLRALMADFYAMHVLEVVTTRDLERHIYCASKDPQVLAAFHRFVYGKDGVAPVPPADFCD